MTRRLVLLSLASLLWTPGLSVLCAQDAGTAPEKWKSLAFTTSALTPAELAGRDALPVPGVAPRAGVASPTRSPWINANGWRFLRAHGGGKYAYDVPAGRAALATAEAFAYGADAVIKIVPGDQPAVGAMLTFLKQLPEVSDLAAPDAAVADLAVVDDGTPITGEVMNLLSRRNLLFAPVKAPSTRYKINITVGSKEYPQAEAADPSGFALKVRRQLTDEQRTLRIYGSEVVIGHLTSKGGRARLHLLNYGGRDIEGLRVRVRGSFKEDATFVAGTGRAKLDDLTITDGATEFSLPRMGAYAVVDLSAR